MKGKMNFSNFVKKMKSLVGTSKDSYDTTTSREKFFQDYNAERVRSIVESGTYEQLSDLSEAFYNFSGIYSRILNFYSNLLTYDVYTRVKKLGDKNLKNDQYEKDYNSACFYADTVLNPQLNYPRMILKALIYGGYYGILLEDGEYNSIIRDLPAQYCRSRFKNYSNVDILELDMRYFDTLTTDVDVRNQIIKDEFPKEFAKGYQDYLADNNENRWFKVPDEYGVVFYFKDEMRPPVLAMVVSIANLMEYINIEKDIDKQVLEKILVQKIPMDKEGNFLLDTTEGGDLHEGVVSMLAGLPHVDVLTTFAEVNIENLGERSKGEKDNLEKIERSVYSEAGIPQQLFSPQSVTGLDDAIQAAATFVFFIIKKMDNWVTFHINRKYSQSNTYLFEMTTLPITHFNRTEMSEFYMDSSTYGFGKILTFISRGEKQSTIMEMLEIENDILKLHENMIPTSSAHTTSGKVAVKKKEEEEKEPEEQNEEVGDNE